MSAANSKAVLENYCKKCIEPKLESPSGKHPQNALATQLKALIHKDHIVAFVNANMTAKK